jgi:diguanylate cyclase (GGDEF)-like protein/PAS domain S-box-containing protein
MDPAIPTSLAPSAGSGTLLLELIIILFAACAALVFAVVNRQRTLTRLRQAERTFLQLYQNIDEGVFRSTLDGRMISANPALVRLNGYASEEELLASVNDIASEWYVDPNRRAELHALLVEHGIVQNFVSEVYRHKTRERIWIEESTRLARDPTTGEPLYYDGIIREVTEAVRRQQLQNRVEKTTSLIPGCVYQHRLRPDGTSHIPYASIGLKHIYGVAPETVAEDASILVKVVHPDDIDRVLASFEESARTLKPRECEYRVRTATGEEKWVFGQSIPEREPDGSVLWHGFMTDITERKRAEARITDLAFFDALTGLPNRANLLAGLGDRLAGSGRTGEFGALLFIDLDQFKVLNDTKGHHVGDRLLCEVAARLRSRVRDRDLLARLGGDEFVVALAGLGDSASASSREARRIGGDLLAILAEPFVVEGLPFQTTASIGIALFSGSEIAVEDLLKRADLAMYQAKAAGGGGMSFFQPEMLAVLEKKVALTADLRDALDRGGLTLLYQPQIDSQGRCFGAEALLRWNHPVSGVIEPGDFLALAEPAGLAAAIDEFVVRTAISTLRAWRDDPLTSGLELAINVNARQLGHRGFAEMVEAELGEAGVEPGRLILELTEHVMLDDVEKVTAIMDRLRAFGVRFALDDFGTGYSTLSHLNRLPIDALKIDRSFVNDLETDRSDRAIVQTIISISRSLRITVIAEGVETEVQALLLRQLGCHAYQGHLFAEAMTLDAFMSELPAMQGAAVPIPVVAPAHRLVS